MKRFTTTLCLLCAFVIILCAQTEAEVDSADLQFSENRILSENEFSITTPNNGEHWSIGDEHTILWNPTDAAEKVKIELSLDSGSTWAVLFDSTEISRPDSTE